MSGAFIRYSSAWGAAAVRSLAADITNGGLTLDQPVADQASLISADGPAAGAHEQTTDERIVELATLTDRDELSFAAAIARVRGGSNWLADAITSTVHAAIEARGS